MVVLVDRGTASAAEIVTGALKDRGRAKVVGTHTYGKGVFQEIQQLSNGGALDMTVGEYFTPSGRNLGGGGVREGPGQAQRLCARQPPHRARPALKVAERTVAAEHSERASAGGPAPRRFTCRRDRAPRQVPGRRAVLSVRAAAGRQPRSQLRTLATWCWCARAPPAIGAARGGRRSLAGWEARRGPRRDRRADDRPRVASRLRSGRRARGAIWWGTRPAALHGAGRRDLRSLPTFTIDPVSARDFDDAISAVAEDDGSARVWVHIADVSAYVRPRSLVDREAYRRGTSVYVPGAVEPMLPTALSNNACSLVPGQDRLTVTVEMLVRGEVGAARGVLPVGDPLGRAARLWPCRPDLRGGERSRALGHRWRRRGVAAALGARRALASALVLESAEPEFEFDRSGDVVAAEPVHQTESHRLIEQLMIAANEQVARHLEQRRVPTLYRVHERPDAVAQRLIEQLASLGVPTPPMPRGPMTPQQAADLVGRLTARATGSRATTVGAPRPDEPRAAVAEAGLLRPSQPGSRRAAVPELLPFHLPDPPLPGPDLPPRAVVGGGR